MSRLTKCNRCNLEAMKRRGLARGVRVFVELQPPFSPMAGWMAARYEDQVEPSAYFMELPDECACDT